MNKKTIISSLLILTLVSSSFCAQSKILSKIQEFMPNFTEIGWITNVINCYYQVSQFVRSTNKVIDNMRMVKYDIDRAKAEIRTIYWTCQSLQDISLYDMDTWQAAIHGMNYLITEQLRDVEETIECFHIHTLYASEDYMCELESLKDVDIRKTKVNDKFCKTFLDANYTSTMEAFNIGRTEYYKLTLTSLQNEYAYTQQLFLQTFNEKYKEQLYNLQKKIEYVESRLAHGDIPVQRMKIDSIIEDARSMITLNLMETHEIERQLEKIQEQSAELINQYNKLTDNNIATVKSPKELVKEFESRETQYGKHPNQAPAPETPKEIEKNNITTTNKKKVSSEDIAQFENMICFLLLKQECMLRDISAMKCNTIAFTLALEAFEQDLEETQGIVNATHCHANAIRIGKGIQ